MKNDYIPALAKVDPELFGIALVITDDKVYTLGDAKTEVSIQSISKVFSGGFIAVSPGKFGIAVIAPPLDDAGNSVKAQKVIADISSAVGGNPLASTPR